MTKFSSTHIFKGRIKNIMQQSNGMARGRCNSTVAVAGGYGDWRLRLMVAMDDSSGGGGG
jgi:hypothetical protein